MTNKFDTTKTNTTNTYAIYIGRNYHDQYEDLGIVKTHNESDTIDIISECLKSMNILGATMIPTIGLWNGEVENGYKIEIIQTEEWFESIEWVAKRLCFHLQQECVLMTINGTQSIEFYWNDLPMVGCNYISTLLYGVQLNGRIGKWSAIDAVAHNNINYYLMEHDTFGDMAGCLLLDENLNELCETWDDILTTLEDLEII